MSNARILGWGLAFLSAICLPFNFDTPGAKTALAQGAAPTAELAQVVDGLSSPVFVTNAHDGSNRLFIIEQPGRIKVLHPDSAAPSTFLNIASKVLSGGEQGLLGLAFHPQFSANRRFFVDYTRQPDGATVIAEYRASASNPDVADTNEKTLLVIPQPFVNHNGGMLAFGPDGFLYIGMGDGGSANDPGNRAQNIEELLGKILRIDVDRAQGGLPYASPSGNPFVGAPGRDEIYAYGLRNPWRFSFDRATGQLYAGDVGQGAREEIDIITRGGNYGWRVMEGTACTNNDPALCGSVRSIAPIAEYTHAGGRCSVTGGYVYRGTLGALPVGSYVYADFCTGEIFLLNGGASSLLLDTPFNITSFGEDEAGEIYVVGQGGTVHRFKNANDLPQTFTITGATVRRRSSGETLDPLTVQRNGKKFEIVVFEQGPTPTLESADATLFVNGERLDTVYTTADAGTPIFVGRLKRKMIRKPGTLLIEVHRTNGTRSNTLEIQVLPGQ
jgi:glucose/arabinose dehydrogenase